MIRRNFWLNQFKFLLKEFRATLIFETLRLHSIKHFNIVSAISKALLQTLNCFNSVIEAVMVITPLIQRS